MTATLTAPETEGEPPGSDPAQGWSSRRPAPWRLVICLVVVVAALGWLALRGLTGSFVYYLTPSDITVDHKAQVDERVRLGGYVVPGSVHRRGGALTFTVTDRASRMHVLSTGPVPQMFRAGQGVVLEGALGHDGRFHSDTLLVKHDGEYRAPTSGGGQ